MVFLRGNKAYFCCVSLILLLSQQTFGKMLRGANEVTLRFAVVPSNQAAKSIDNIKFFGQCLERQMPGIRISTIVPGSYMAVVEGLGAKKIDIALTDITSYIVADQKYGVELIARIKRFGSEYYYSMILVKKNGPIKTVQDLNGKKFAYSDAISASSYILPHIYLKSHNIKLAQEVSLGSMQAAIIGLLQNKVDAVGAYYFPPSSKGELRDAREKLLSVYPSLTDQTHVLWVSDRIPNEPVVARKGLSEAVIQKVKKAVPICFQEGARLINNIDDSEPVKAYQLREYKEFVAQVKGSGLDVGKILQEQGPSKSSK